MWRAVPRIVVHTEAERTSFRDAFGVPRQRVALADHGADFVRHTLADRLAARESLGIGPDVVTFLSIGFIQPHKGFDRAVRGLAKRGETPWSQFALRYGYTDQAHFINDVKEFAGVTPAELETEQRA